MSLEVEEQWPPKHPDAVEHEPQKKDKLLYSTDFLLSLSKLDVCTKLPAGFDLKILSEFDEAFDNVQDWQKIPGSSSLQSFRREYGSSPPTRGDSSNYSRGTHGRWDSRSSGRGDRDSDSQSDWDAESGRWSGNQPRRSLQNPEHDGLLGSGSFPRPSGYATGASAPKARSNDQYQLNRSTEPYHPPRPYKPLPHLRRDAKDSLNDETFGPSECTSHDRAEEERRRASFELMRKEQFEKQKLNPNQHKEKLSSDMSFLLEDSKVKREMKSVDNVLNECHTEPGQHNGSGKPYISSQVSPARPLVPPGFTSVGLEKIIGMKSSNRTIAVEEIEDLQRQSRPFHLQGNRGLNENSVNHEERKSELNMDFSGQQFGTVNSHFQHVNKGEKAAHSSTLEIPKMSDVLGPDGIVEDSELITLTGEKRKENKKASEPGQDQSMTLLQKLFSSSTINDGNTSSLVERHDAKGEVWSPKKTQSSKFAHWFLEEEKKTVDDFSSGRSSDLLSLIAGGDNGGRILSHVEHIDQTGPVPPKFSERKDSHMVSNVSSMAEGSDELCGVNKSEAVPAVLTCEDLEQSILSEVSESGNKLHPSNQSLSILESKIGQPRASSDDPASQHLLSLLRKGGSLKEISAPTSSDMVPEKLHVLEAANSRTSLGNSEQGTLEKASVTGGTLTLETLFGSAFMKELQDSVGSARTDGSEPHGLPSSAVDGLLQVDNNINHNSNVLPLVDRQDQKLGNWEHHLLRFDGPRTEVDGVTLQSELRSKTAGLKTENEIQLPEEESLFAITEPINASSSSFVSPVDLKESQLPSLQSAPVAEKIVALNAVFRDEHMINGQEGPPFLRRPYGVMEPELQHQSLHHHSSSANFNPSVNRRRPSFHPFDSHAGQVNPHFELSPDGSAADVVSLHHQLSGNILHSRFQHQSTGLSGFDTRHHHMLQPMHMPGNFAPPDLRELSRGSHATPQPNNHNLGFLQDSNMLHDFSVIPQNSNFGGRVMPLPAPGAGGNNHPEFLQRLLQRDDRSNPKQLHPFPLTDHTQAMYSRDLETGIRYR